MSQHPNHQAIVLEPRNATKNVCFLFQQFLYFIGETGQRWGIGGGGENKGALVCIGFQHAHCLQIIFLRLQQDIVFKHQAPSMKYLEEIVEAGKFKNLTVMFSSAGNDLAHQQYTVFRHINAVQAGKPGVFMRYYRVWHKEKRAAFFQRDLHFLRSAGFHVEQPLVGLGLQLEPGIFFYPYEVLISIPAEDAGR